jgi:peptidoglycan/LPS O-acetylase OafA/YrhL
MFGLGKDHWAQSRQLFEDQFEPDVEGYLYRRSQKGPPIRVTADERQRFIDEYIVRLKRGTWVLTGALILGIAIWIWWSVENDVELQDWAIYAGIAGFVAFLIPYFMWVWGAPARELARRTPVGNARSTAEVRRRFLVRTSYGQLAAAAFGGAVLPFTLLGEHDVLRGWERIWLIIGGALVLLCAMQAFRKWRYERRDRQ